jgi:hypothetical protein
MRPCRQRAQSAAARLFLMVDDDVQAGCSGRCSRLFAALLLALFGGCYAAVPWLFPNGRHFGIIY